MKTFPNIALVTTLVASMYASPVQCDAVNVAAQHDVARDFAQRRELVAGSGCFSIFDTNLSPRQRELLEFLYAYMPLPDMADYSGEFYKENVDLALRARKEMPWGESVPEREFRHFVLPVRVNNENLDMSRRDFYESLRDRVKDMSMRDAVLEVNHWCHERVTYRPSDARTSSPSATVRSAIGRCGEESTFTVAALRAVGIPARQVYTPRWAHTDDNHAWVEAWVDGEWHFLGACEPEAVLDLGWFNAPASRGMLMNTKLFGRYDGPEQQLATAPCYTEVNVTDNYAPVDTLRVMVTDASGKPVKGARVDYRLYNYGEFFPVATLETDAEGRSELVAGRGDIIVWGSDSNGRFGFVKARVGADSNIVLKLDSDSFSGKTADFDIVPPVQRECMPFVPKEAADANVRRLAYEDSLRNAYEATFFTPERAREFALTIGADPGELAVIMPQSRGNHAVIAEFLKSVPKGELGRAIDLLKAVSEKDRRDIAPEVLADHFATPAPAPGAEGLYVDYILNPRIADEMLTPYKRFFLDAVPSGLREKFVSDPASWVKWVADNIEIDNRWNPRRVAMSPASVWKLRTTDARSRDIFFVAAARAMGIPARIDPVTDKAQYAAGNQEWVDAVLPSGASLPASPGALQGALMADFKTTGRIDNPAYYSNFTISKLENGVPVLLNYPEDATWSGMLKEPMPIEAGEYMLTTGQRMADGTVLSRSRFFTVVPGETTRIPLEIRQDTTGVQVIGSFNSENIYHDMALATDKSILSTTGRGYYVIGLVAPNHEPTVHVLNDLSSRSKEIEATGVKVLLLFADEAAASRFDRSKFPDLPSNVVFGTDIDGKIASELASALKITPDGSIPDARSLPAIVVADTFNRVVFNTNGYTIGVGDRLMDTLHSVTKP